MSTHIREMPTVNDVLDINKYQLQTIMPTITTIEMLTTITTMFAFVFANITGDTGDSRA